MSPPGRPKGESLSAQHEGSPVTPPGRPNGDSLSAQHEGSPVSRPVRPAGGCPSAQREGSPMSPPSFGRRDTLASGPAGAPVIASCPPEVNA